MKIKNLLFPAFLLFVISCKKTESSNTPPPDIYLTTSAGSTWNYHEINSSSGTPVNSDYTLTSTSKDSLINAKSYHVYTNSAAGNEYFYISGNDYYQFDSSLAALGVSIFERLYLKSDASVGNTWSQSLTVTIPMLGSSIPITVTNKIIEKNISRTVNSTNYSGVIHVATSISSSAIPAANLTTSIDSYYAKNYGLIENSTIINLNYLGFVENINVETKLVSATLL